RDKRFDNAARDVGDDVPRITVGVPAPVEVLGRRKPEGRIWIRGVVDRVSTRVGNRNQLRRREKRKKQRSFDPHSARRSRSAVAPQTLDAVTYHESPISSVRTRAPPSGSS